MRLYHLYVQEWAENSWANMMQNGRIWGRWGNVRDNWLDLLQKELSSPATWSTWWAFDQVSKAVAPTERKPNSTCQVFYVTHNICCFWGVSFVFVFTIDWSVIFSFESIKTAKKVRCAECSLLVLWICLHP